MPLSETARKTMLEHARIAKESMAKGGGGTGKKWDLTGQNALVEAGGAFVLRLLPRWDVKNKWVLGADKKWTQNPNYIDDVIYYVASEHWWDDTTGKPHREWCPKTLDEGEACPLCEASATLKASTDKADRDIGYRMTAKKTYLFNGTVGGAGKRAVTADGKPDIRMFPAGNTLFVPISILMTGGVGEEDGQQQFSKGDLGDPREGFDLKVTRPREGERWTLICANDPSPLYTEAEKPVWSQWMNHLIDLPATVEGEVKSYDDLYAAYWGEPPAAGGTEPAAPDPAFAPDPGAMDTPGFDAPAPGGGGAPADPFDAVGTDQPPFDPPPGGGAPARPARPATPAPAGRRPAAPAPAARGNARGGAPAGRRPAPRR